jgi:hypothetical protein
MRNLTLESPVNRRRGHGPSNPSNIQVTSAMREDSMMYSPLTPNKKRRFDYGPPPITNSRRPDGPYYTLPGTQFANRRDSLPPIQVHQRFSPPNSAIMPPPRTPRDAQRTSVVELGPPSHDSSPQSVEEVLSAFPYPNKIKLLGRITPPYKEAGTGSPTSRGAIVAIEGDDLAAIKELSEWLNEYLIRQKEYKPRIAEPPKVPENEDKEVTFEDYLDLIKEWHGKSKEMIKVITTPCLSASSSQDTDTSDKGSEKDVVRKDSATPPDSPALGVSTKPVIILPTFQLQASIAYASRIPIQDAYSATDHWQWMATLWRGTVGPDLTLYVKTYDAKEGHPHEKPTLDDSVRCLTVFKEKEGKFAEADLRRVGFEVNEWIKGNC